MNHRWLQSMLKVCCLGLAYFITGRLGLMFPVIGSNITVVWLPSGIAVGALYRWGFRCWPGITLGALAVEVAIGSPWPVGLATALGNTLAPLLTVWLLRRLRFQSQLERQNDILLLFAAPILAMTVSATIGATSLLLAGMLPGGWIRAWSLWWAADTIWVIGAAPLLLTASRSEWREILRHWVEFATWTALILTSTLIVFVWNGGPQRPAWELAFLPLLFVAWAALRFGATGTSLAVIVLSVGAAYGTATGRGPFFRMNAMESAVLLWFYMATSTALGWLITAIEISRTRALRIRQLLERALDEVALGVLLAGIDRRITYANAGFTRLTGYTEAELLGKSCSLLQGPETAWETIAGLKAAFQADGMFDGEILNYRKDGTTFWNSLLISPIHNEQGELTGYLGIQRDVTRRKEVESALYHSEEHLRAIVELEPECVKIVSPEGLLQEMNPAGLRMLEADSLDQVRGAPVVNLIEPADRATFTALQRRVLAGESGTCEFAIIGLKGTHRWLETHAVPYRNAQREIVGVLGITRDITQRKESAIALERSLATLQILVNSVPAFISFVDAEERYRLVNRTYEQYFGMPAERIIGQRVRDLQPPAAYAEMEPHLRAALAGQMVQYQSNPSGPDGKPHWFDVQYIPRRESNGAVSGFFVMVFDTTDRKQAEAEIRVRETELARFKSTLDQTLDCVFMFRSDDFRFIYVNEGAKRQVGYDECELFGMTPLDLKPVFTPEQFRQLLQPLLDGTAASRTFESVHRHKDGHDIPVEVSLQFVRQTVGVPRFVAIVRDITERKRAEAALKQSEQRFRILASHAPVGIFMTDVQGNCLFVNESWCTLAGLTPEEALGSGWTRALYSEDRNRVVQEWYRAAQSGKHFESDYRYQTSGGRITWLHGTAARLLDERGEITGYIGTVTDMTERILALQARRESEEKLRELNLELEGRVTQRTRELEEKNVELEAFAHSVSHDLRAPLRAMEGFAAALAEDYGHRLDDAGREFILHIKDSARRMDLLVNDLLAYSRLGRLELRLSPVRLQTVVREALAQLTADIGARHAKIDVAEPLPTVLGHQATLVQVVTNLISNGIKFVAKSVLPEVRIWSERTEKGDVRLWIEDNGIGIAVDHQERIFRVFERLHGIESYPGTGIGLAIVSRACERLGGRYGVESQRGRGSRFWVEFPGEGACR